MKMLLVTHMSLKMLTNWITNNGSYSITESDDKLTITAFNFEGKAGRRVFALFTFDNYNEDIENYEKYAYKRNSTLC